MKNINLIFKSLFLSCITTIIFLIINVLYLFTTVPAEPATFTTYFGAINVYVATEGSDFGFQLSFGLSESLTPIWFTLVLFSIIYFIAFFFFNKFMLTKSESA